jgi:TetR/AcrR family transcriptional regulator, cholesterol catabolism regulator
MIGVLSGPIFWFKKDRDTPATIAKKMLSILRTGVEDAN